MNFDKIIIKKWLNCLSKNKFYNNKIIKFRSINITFFIILTYLLFLFNNIEYGKAKNNIFNNVNKEKLSENASQLTFYYLF